MRPHRLLSIAVVLCSMISGATGAAAAGHTRDLWMGGRRVTLSPTTRVRIPSYARQTNLPCNACHTTFPQLTTFGRLFKLNGYTLTGIPKVQIPSGENGPGLSLPSTLPVSAMVQTSISQTRQAVPGQSNTSVDLPQELSLFIGEAITPKAGTFLQFTYASADGSFAIDNMDVRFATHTTAFGQPTIFGLTLNNNPTVQDVWNTVPAWNFPYASSEAGPSPLGELAIGDAYGQQVAGLGAYVFWKNLIYAELSGYHWAPQGGPNPPDTTAEGDIKGVAPYWRVAVSHDFGPNSLELGSFGMVSNRYPVGIISPTDRFTDIAFDAQYQRAIDQHQYLSLHGLFVRENQKLDASVADEAAGSLDNHLNSLKLDASMAFSMGAGATLAYFTTTGSKDPLLYPADPLEGSATGAPDSRGWIGQVNYNAWQNVRLGAQYVLYNRFNGAGSNYDGEGRNASDNNTLFLLAWLVF